MCGFVSPAHSRTERLIRKQGAFETNRERLVLPSKDRISHCETWPHSNHVSTPIVELKRGRRRDESRAGGVKGSPLCRQQCHQPVRRRSLLVFATSCVAMVFHVF